MNKTNKKPRKASKSIKNPAIPELFYDPEGSIAYIYTRAQAIADGVQVDVSAMAMKVGIYCPFYITSTIYAACVIASAKALGLSEQTALKRFLEIVKTALIQVNKSRITFHFVVLDGSLDRREKVIIAHCTQDVTNWIPAITGDGAWRRLVIGKSI